MQAIRSRPRAIAMGVLLVAGAAWAEPTPPAGGTDPMALPTEIMPLAEHALMLDLARVGEGMVAVGERGHILLSDDGETWKQSANVPLRSTLTAVSAIGNKVWAVGHDGVILHSADAGDSWQIQRRDPWQPADGNAEHELRQGVPLLDVLFSDADNGIAIGAYSLLLSTSDGGKTWNGSRIVVSGEAGTATIPNSDEIKIEGEDSDTFSADELKIGQESDPHLNAIARTGSGAFVIVGERGAVFRSRDGGATWETNWVMTFTRAG